MILNMTNINIKNKDAHLEPAFKKRRSIFTNHTKNIFTKNTSTNGFTLLEVLMVIGILAILAGVVLTAVNPSRQFKAARDSQRTSNVATILNAIGQNMTDYAGNFVCEGQLKSVPEDFDIIGSDDGFDLAPCIVPDYISSLPYDPGKESAYYIDETDYNTGYMIKRDVEGRITIKADSEFEGKDISMTR
jgi:prepilin-type N-terminal cleavage/methylation domain-containing protein